MQTKKVVKITLVTFCLYAGLIAGRCIAQETNEKQSPAWTESFNLEKCTFSSMGKNDYFILEPGYQLILEGIEDKEAVNLTITVLNETKKIGNIETRVVEEKETANDRVIEISRNFYAICTQTNSVFYFGEEVDIYKDGKVVSHSGSWRADSANAKAGLMMPGIILTGARYYQEIAPEVAMDRAEILSNKEALQTPAGKFDNCLKTEETTPLEPQNKEYKIYAPGVGLIQDSDLVLTRHGFTNK
jgi:hypothetical protein